MTSLFLQSQRVVTANGMAPAAVHVADGRIAAVLPHGQQPPAGVPVEDFGASILAPGLVDCHVHVNEPGRTEWEGFATATRAAAAGGITCLVDMPLNCLPVTATAAALAEKRAALNGKLHVDCGFWGAVLPTNHADLPDLLAAGVLGAKCFLIDSGIPEFPPVTAADLDRAMPVLARAGVPLLAHAELELPAPDQRDPRRYTDYLATRPRAWENEAVAMLIELAARHRCATHIVHLSSADCLAPLAEARAAGVPITAETCPHYLTMAAESIPDGDPRYKCAPPIRELANQTRLWRGLAEGVIDFIVSDHSPCTPALKELESGNLRDAWGGIASLQLGLSLMWTALRARGFTPVDLHRWMSAGSADFAGLTGRKGRIAAGHDADLVVWDPDRSFVLTPEAIRHRHRETPYLGRGLYGRVEGVYLRGQAIVTRDGREANPTGKPLLLRNGRVIFG